MQHAIPADDKDMYVPSVEHAATLVGGRNALARRLGVEREDVLAWTRGEKTPSTMALLLVLDIVVMETRKLASAAMAQGLMEITLAKAAAKAATP